MLIAILSDTHLPKGKRVLPARCWELIDQADLAIHAGDFSTAAVLDELEAAGTPLHAVHGNVDDHEVITRLPERVIVEAGGARIGVIHDSGQRQGRLARMRREFPDADAVIFGHSHLPLHERDPESGFQIFNPGSPTERRRAPSHTMGLARVEGGVVEFELVEL